MPFGHKRRSSGLTLSASEPSAAARLSSPNVNFRSKLTWRFIVAGGRSSSELTLDSVNRSDEARLKNGSYLSHIAAGHGRRPFGAITRTAAYKESPQRARMTGVGRHRALNGYARSCHSGFAARRQRRLTGANANSHSRPEADLDCFPQTGHCAHLAVRAYHVRRCEPLTFLISSGRPSKQG